MDYIYLSDALEAAKGASTLDMSDPQIEKWFMDEVKNAYIDEHKKGNLSFYNNKGYCIDHIISPVLEKFELTISEDGKHLKLVGLSTFRCVMLDIEQLINLTHKRCNEANKELTS